MKIVTAVVNNPDFIEIQYHTLKKYFKGDYEFIVFNDAKDFADFTNDGDITLKQQIEDMCNTLNIKCINIPNDHHRTLKCAMQRCADSMNYILNYQKQYPDKYLLIDSDMFMIADFDISRYDNCNSAIVLQDRYEKIFYIWNGIYYFDFHNIKNKEDMDWNPTIYCDVGGMMQTWLRKQVLIATLPSTKKIRYSNNNYRLNNIYFIKHLWSCTWDKTELPDDLKSNTKLLEFLENDPRNENNKYFCEIYDDCFLHYRAGGNWRGEGLHIHKSLTNNLKNAIMF